MLTESITALAAAGGICLRASLSWFTDWLTWLSCFDISYPLNDFLNANKNIGFISLKIKSGFVDLQLAAFSK